MTDTTQQLPAPDPAQIEAFLNVVGPVIAPLIDKTPIGAAVNNIVVPLLHILLQFDIQHSQQNPGQLPSTNPARQFVWQQINTLLSSLHLSVQPVTPKP